MNAKFKFDDFGFDGKLAIVDPAGNFEWVEPIIENIPSESCVRFDLIGSDGEGDEDARRVLRQHLGSYMIEYICDFRDTDAITRAVGKAEAARDRFLAAAFRPTGVQSIETEA
ncbi:hypothetical protein AGRHK599_LOCUS269 [Rhizobium rhizogenes]|uniref:Uncharacterized protein n=1 Tax=Rhizobium rhizogenes TaxID=359 RepID=A0AAN2A243_RHIRH|nr:MULTISPECIES: hypothetical protein [Rhizobium/Agrobacterium group]AQS62605.1 hypothetical protein B0909_10475 [Rhizobium rhizogenes]MCZ7441745.1 hypothetical protein [Rhizobium rhizogenes]NSZ78045.1 hypothetical protein [Agrobacterium tumefaciens]OAM64929.1 hypothetical protein A8L48_17830 [Rhizobium rhizogenes]CAD0210254.1 hypothetical protein AGRHK599_LOCUS269 [Rhizobium rhizogenes]